MPCSSRIWARIIRSIKNYFISIRKKKQVEILTGYSTVYLASYVIKYLRILSHTRYAAYPCSSKFWPDYLPFCSVAKIGKLKLACVNDTTTVEEQCVSILAKFFLTFLCWQTCILAYGGCARGTNGGQNCTVLTSSNFIVD